MSAYLPVTLNGSNLRERHRYLNSLVSKAYEENVSIHEIITLPEKSSIDRIFKIDLASKYKYVEYILQNLKDNEMLYVSRSLKCHWLLEPKYRDIISPLYLEDVLYPEMIQPAVNKMKHWLQLNLKNSEICQEFYNFYKSNMSEAIKFFWHCSNEFILSEFPNIIDKLTPVQVKLLFEICPSACALYFKILPTNRTALSRYVNDECNYFKCVKYLLKHDGSSFLDIVEKYFNMSKFDSFGPSSTEFIMKHYKSRVLAKIELYASSVLNIKTLATSLSSKEANDIILKLARADFLAYWFSYQKVEPLFKRLNIKERTLLKKQIFVDKIVGDKVAEWPYSLPTPLIFEEDFYLLDSIKPDVLIGCGLKKRITKRKCKGYSCQIVSMEKSQLQILFNRYRFTGFERAFRELSKKLLAEGTIEGRLNMMLVLVSKSGGVSEQVEKLLKFLVEKHKNEPNTLRAAVIRSLVKRERVWCVQDQAWDYLVEFGRDIGLDGSTTELTCREGLHAVIIRHLLNDISISKYLLSGFIREFSTLSEYKLNVHEKALIAKRLPLQILTLSPVAFLDVLGEYKISIKEFPDAIPILAKAARDDPDLVSRLYEGKMLRRELFHENFRLKPTDAMYLNALRYDIKPLGSGKSLALLVSKQRTNHDRFLKSLSVYFSESGGLAEQHKLLLEEALEQDLKPWLVRPICTLMTNQSLFRRITELSTEVKTKNKIKSKILSEFKSNAHKTKPTLDIDVIDWRMVGAKAIANKVFICRKKDQERYLTKLVEWRRTAKVLLQLSSNTPFAVDYFARVCTLRSSAALNFGLSSYLTKITIDESIWTALKSLIQNTKNISDNRALLKKLEYPNSIPKNIEGDYWVFVYNIFLKIDKSKTTSIIYRLENILPEVDRNVTTNILKEFIDVDLSVGKLVDNYDNNARRSLYFRVIAKHLLLCKSEDEQIYVNENVCDRFFDALEVLFKTEDNKVILSESLDEFILSLKYTKAFIDEHVSCMTVFERVLSRLHKIIPIEENFRRYAEIHLTMLFYKSIKQTNKLELIMTDSKKRYEVIETLGKVFGKYIGYEIKELVSRYFRSVLDMYKSILENYLDNYFVYNYARKLFVTFVIKGILEAGTNEALLLAEHIFQRNQNYYISEPHHSEILNVLKQSNSEVKFFLYSNVFNA
ncbi:uncharacterized protein LOC126778430 [Nymphalis io]|uniref:uncharacterized protein LOC126778430 n=1 Tax=Inachis io TaxID=171585 RepID=UPI0021688BC1|nr:uncharacterized protein LOC126778430 [Nymphalis io]XP_050357907.1 uncharacterized protein LOC126778430 [Nymphalis io]